MALDLRVRVILARASADFVAGTARKLRTRLWFARLSLVTAVYGPLDAMTRPVRKNLKRARVRLCLPEVVRKLKLFALLLILAGLICRYFADDLLDMRLARRWAKRRVSWDRRDIVACQVDVNVALAGELDLWRRERRRERW